MRRAAITAAAVAVGLLSACGSDQPARPAAPKPTSAPLTLISGTDIDTLDPGASYEPFTFTVLDATQRRLFDTRPGAPRTLVPDLAAAPAVIRDGGRTIRIRIRSGIRYSPPLQKRMVRAQDFAYALRRAFSKQVANGYVSAYFGDVVGAPDSPTDGVPEIRGITTPDDSTLEIRLRRAVAPVVVSALQLPISAPVPESYAARFDRRNPSTYKDHVVGTGPYRVPADSTGRITGYRADSGLRLVRNPSWDRASDNRPAYTSAVDVKTGFQDSTLATREVVDRLGRMQGNFFLPQNVIVDIMRRRRSLATRIPTTGVEMLAMRVDRKPLDDLELRLAIALALDRKALLKLRGGALAGRVATGFFPSGFLGLRNREVDPVLRNPAGDLAAARRHLAAARPATRARLAAGSLTLNQDTDEALARSAEAIKFQLGRIGIKVRLVHSEGCVAGGRPMDLCTGTFYADFYDPQALMQPLFSSVNAAPGGSNTSGYRNASVDAELKRASAVPNGPKRLQAWAALEKRVLARMPVVPILWNDFEQVHSSDVEAVVDDVAGYFDLTASYRR